MSIRNIIARGIGFLPASVRFIVTGGFGGSGVAPSPTLTLRDLFCGRNFANLADVLDFITDFNAIIADNSILSDADQEYLLSMGGMLEDGDRFTVLDAYVRDWWLDRVLWAARAPTAENPRLPTTLAMAMPTTYSESDPFGIATGTHDIIIDQDNINSVVVRPTTNDVYDYTNTAFQGLLWLTATDSTYRISRLWKTPSNMLEGNSINRRRFPYDGSAVRVYIRGGVYDIATTVGLSRFNPAATHNSRIEIMAYPGEYVQWNCSSPASGNNFTDTSYALSILGISGQTYGGRPNVWVRGIHIQPWRDNVVVPTVGTGRVFCPKVIGINPTGESGSFENCRLDHISIANGRAISPNHNLAGSLPEFVDLAFTKRTGIETKSVDAEMLTSYGVKIGSGADDLAITDLTMTMGGDDFPLSLSDPDNTPPYVHGDFIALGEGIDYVGGDNLTIYRSNLAGHPSHQSIRCNGGTNLKVRFSTLTAKENSCLGGGGDVRFNRITYYGATEGADGGNGVQFAGTGCVLSDNVIWNPLQVGQGFGISMLAQRADGGEIPVDTPCVDNVLERNILYGVGMGLRYSSGTLDPTTNLFTGNVIRQNVIVDRPLPNASDPGYDAPISLFIRPEEYDLNDVSDNLIYRTDGSQVAIIVQTYNGLGGYTYTPLEAGTAVLPFADNFAGDPMFRDPVSGDFRLRSGSPVDWLHEDCPLVAFDSAWGRAPYPCPVQGGLVEYAVGPSIMRYAPQQTQFGYAVANSRPLYGVQER